MGSKANTPSPFKAWVPSLGIKQITFYVDHKKYKTLKSSQAKNGKYTVTIDPKHYTYGSAHGLDQDQDDREGLQAARALGRLRAAEARKSRTSPGKPRLRRWRSDPFAWHSPRTGNNGWPGRRRSRREKSGPELDASRRRSHERTFLCAR